jgi:flagellar biosynthesis protein FlhG
MVDQASVLREAVKGPSQEPWQMSAASQHQPVAVAITSGKGGVGKTNVVANLAVALANMGKRVLVLDADFGMANIDVLLGLAPKYNLSDFLYGPKTLEEIVIEGPSGIRIVPASSGIERMTALTVEQQTKLIRGLSQLGVDTDYLLIDTAAGISSNVINLLLAAGVVIVVTAPDPTAIVDAYLVVKILAHRESQKKVYILVNSVTDRREALAVFRQIDSASKRFLDKPLELFGHIERDPNVVDAVRHQLPVVNMLPEASASRCLNNLARKLHQEFSARRNESGGLSWDVLFEATASPSAVEGTRKLT